MTLPEARRGFPTYRSVSGAEPARVGQPWIPAPVDALSRGQIATES